MNKFGNIKVMLLAVSLFACGGSGSGGRDNSPSRKTDTPQMPDELPVMTNSEIPFRYPPALYAQKVQGNVSLRIYVDSTGKIDPDSTRVVETSGQSALDSAAVRGARDLTFVPAKRHGNPVPASILFPVYFRHPEASPMPGDSLLKKSSTTVPGNTAVKH